MDDNDARTSKKGDQFRVVFEQDESNGDEQQRGIDPLNKGALVGKVALGLDSWARLLWGAWEQQ